MKSLRGGQTLSGGGGDPACKYQAYVPSHTVCTWLGPSQRYRMSVSQDFPLAAGEWNNTSCCLVTTLDTQEKWVWGSLKQNAKHAIGNANVCTQTIYITGSSWMDSDWNCIQCVGGRRVQTLDVCSYIHIYIHTYLKWTLKVVVIPPSKDVHGGRKGLGLWEENRVHPESLNKIHVQM